MRNKIYVLSAGPGDPEELTPAVKEALMRSCAAAAAPRHRHLAGGHPNIIDMKDFKETFAALRSELDNGDVSVLVSGDAGIYSLLPLIKKNFQQEESVVLPGISSFQSVCAKACATWQDAVILSGHGRGISDEKILDAVEHNRSVIFFCDADKNPAWLCSLLAEAGLGAVEAVTGERLGASGERVRRARAEELAKESFDPLSIVLLINEEHTARPALLPQDEDFIRTEGVPMTHEEVRAAIIAKLRLTRDDVLWDIGAGTGSVSIAAAQICAAVHAVEVNAAAADLVRRNAEKFRLHNIKVYEMSAMDALYRLPAPDAVFIGGSGKELPAILERVASAGAGIRVAV
ncbi:MAG: precorrin-6y C5,15-methyltransferase (decarboxylating) subunit CbiE, partial [Synergistes sp.]|nr:precorrin-6y C5,15-methyltransferase (decarboxylating) subunit CbiE [Synergistes sp.]